MLAARWLIYLGGGVIALLYSYFSGGTVITTSIYRLLFVLASTLAYLAYVSYFGQGRLPLPMRLGLIFCEVALVSLLVALTGGLASPFVSLLWLLVILNSVDHGEQLGVAAALLCCLGLGAMARGMGAYSPSQLGGLWLGLVAMGALGFVLGGRQSGEVSYGGDAGREIDRAHRIARQQSRERKVREEQLYYERRRFEGLVEVANSLASLRSRDELLSQIVERALEQMEVEASAVLLLDEENNLVVSEARGVSIPTRQRLEGPVGECFLGRVLQTGDILTFDESQTHEVLHHYGELGAFSEVVRGSHQALNQGFTNRGETFRNFIVVPLFTSQDRFSFGLLFVANLRSRDCYSSNDVGYLRILATNAAIALRNLEAKSRIEQTHFEMIQALAQAIEAKDLYTSNHVGRVRDLSVRIAEVMGLAREEVREIGIAATLHDVGKISTPDRILSKPGALDAEEYETMKAHAENGANILKNIKSLPPSVHRMVLHHHERWDGKGYPRGLVGDQIPLGAQIISVADCYDAMTWDRPYRRGFSKEEALKRMEHGCGTQFNSKILCAFFAMCGYQPRHSPEAVASFAQTSQSLQLERPPTFSFATMSEVPEIGVYPGFQEGGTPAASAGRANASSTKEKRRVLQIETKKPSVLHIEPDKES